MSNSLSVSGWFAQVTGQTSRPAPSRPPQAARPDRTEVSGRRPDRGGILQQARSRVSGLLDGTSGAIESLGRGGSQLVQGFSDFLGRSVSTTTGVIGDAGGLLTRGATRAGAAGLEAAGAPQAAARLRAAGATASRAIEGSSRSVGQTASSFVSGVGDGLGGLVEGVGTAVAHPIQTAQAISRLDQLINPISQLRAVAEGRNPLAENLQTVGGIIEGVREGYRETGRDHGTAGQVGRAVFDVATTLATGGSTTAGRVGLRASANLLDDFARVSRAAAEGGEVANAGRLAQSAGSFVGRRLNGPLAPVAERLTGAAESGSQALVRRAQRLEERNLARGQARAGEVPGADGAEILQSTRQQASGLSGRLRTSEAQWRAGGAEREALVENLPGPTRQRVRELEAQGQTDQALELLQRHQVEATIRAGLDDVARVDELYPTQLPPEVDASRVLAQGRRESLEFMLDDPTLSADGLRRNFRHIVGDSDVTGPVYIQQYKAGDQVGRAFSSSAGRETGIGSNSRLQGGYFGAVDDAQLSRSQIQARNAVGLDNHADRFAVFTLPEDTYGVVSRIGEQFDLYGHHAVGGNIQVTFPGAVQPINPRVSDVGRLSAQAQRRLDAAAATGATGQITSEPTEG
ncbi:MAG: hypothetical protein AB7S38_35115 [Vulcanimicrobiota bacterium]